MATYNNGILGSFSGAIGPVIGSQWRGKSVIRSKPTKSNKAPSPAQQLQRDKFAFALQFLNPIKALLMETFGENQSTKTPFNNALSYHLKEAVQHHANGFYMAYPKVLIGQGPLCGIAQTEVTVLAPRTLRLQWADNSDQGMAYADDSLLVIAYSPTLHTFELFLETALREDTQAILEFPDSFRDHHVELWATFTNTATGMTATSTYLGSYLL